MNVIIACDPGGRYTGLVVRYRNGVVDHAVLQAAVRKRRALPPATYMLEVVEWLRAAKTHVESYGHDPRVAVEGMVEPSWYIDGEEAPLQDPATHMGMAMVHGGVMCAFPDAIEVRPGGHGKNGLRTYPAELVGAREKREDSKGILRHARSAWDIAGQAERIIRQPRLAWHTGDA